jgi:hypothetical protein
VRSELGQCDQELASLARETRQVAETIAEPEIRQRLFKIADALLYLACPVKSQD